jgi:hypothetical protein
MSEQNLDVAKQRSPTYPYITLDMAAERAAKLYEQVRDTPQPREVMAKAYGKPLSSSATMQTFSTLTQYGLLEAVAHNGQRRLRVTQLARSITNPNAPTAVVIEGRKKAALNPPVFRELWDLYGSTEGLNDSAILYYLTVDRPGTVFTDLGAQQILRIYRATVAYAGLSDSDKNPPVVEQDGGGEPEADTLPPADESRREAARKQDEQSAPKGQVKLMDGERVAFIEEGQPGQYLKLIASGDVDDTLLEALEDYVKRQRKRLGITPPSAPPLKAN